MQTANVTVAAALALVNGYDSSSKENQCEYDDDAGDNDDKSRTGNVVECTIDEAPTVANRVSQSCADALFEWNMRWRQPETSEGHQEGTTRVMSWMSRR